jgi:hypothetical protein
MKATLKRNTMLVTLIILASNCAPKASSTAGNKPTPAQTQPADSGTPATPTGTNNSGSQQQLTGYKNYTFASSAPIYVGQSMTKTTVKSLASSSGKKLLVFQMSGVTCEECFEHTTEALQQLQPYSKDIGFYVIFPTPRNEYPVEQYQGYITNHAKGTGTSFVVDDTAQILQATRRDLSQFYGMFLIVRPDGTLKNLNQVGDVNRLGQEVITALGK